MSAAPVCVWDLGAELGEGPVWWEDALWFVDIKAPRLHRYDPGRDERRSWDAPAPIGFALPTTRGDLIVGLKSGLHRFDPSTGRFTLIVEVEPAALDNRLNDAAVDREGRLWFGSMHDPESAATGALYRLEPDGTVRRFDEGYVVTNGPAFSPDGRTLYHTDSARQRIFAFDLDGEGLPSNKRLFLQIDEPNVYPDGPVVDVEGCLWTGLFGGWSVRRYDPLARRLSAVALPCARVTKAAFGGPDLTTLYITTARVGLSERERAEQPLAGGLFAADVDVAGLPNHLIRLNDGV